MIRHDDSSPPNAWHGFLRLFATTLTACISLVAQDPSTMPMLDGTGDLTSFWRQTRNCGPNTLYVLANAMGHEIDYEQLCNAAAPNANGCTLAELRTAADALGVPTRFGKMTASDLRSATEPLILHFESGGGAGEATGHFVLLTQWRGERAEVMDGTSGRYRRIDAERLLRKWSGYVIAVDRRWDWTLLLWGLGGSALVAIGYLALRAIRQRQRTAPAPEPATRIAAGAVAILLCTGVATLPAQQHTDATAVATTTDTSAARLVSITCPHRLDRAEVLDTLPDSAACVDGCRCLRAVLHGREWRVIHAQRVGGEVITRDIRWWRDQLIFREGDVRRFSVMDKATALDGWRETVQLFDASDFERLGCECANTVGALTTVDAPGISLAGWRLPSEQVDTEQAALRIVPLTTETANAWIGLKLKAGDMVGDWRQGHLDGAVRGHLDYAVGGDLDRMLTDFPKDVATPTSTRALAFALGGLALLGVVQLSRQRANSRRKSTAEAHS